MSELGLMLARVDYAELAEAMCRAKYAFDAERGWIIHGDDLWGSRTGVETLLFAASILLDHRVHEALDRVGEMEAAVKEFASARRQRREASDAWPSGSGTMEVEVWEALMAGDEAAEARLWEATKRLESLA